MKRHSLPALTFATRGLGVSTPLAVVAGPSPADILCSTVALLFLLDTSWRRDFAWLRQDWLMASLLLWAYLCIRALFATNLADALGLALPFVRYVIFAAALQCLVLRDAEWRRRLAVVTVVGVTFVALDGLLQYVSGHDIIGRPMFANRLVGFHEHPRLGTMIAWLFIPAALMLVAQERYLLVVAFGALCLTAIILSGDRMALLMTLFALGLLGLLSLRFPVARRAILIATPFSLLILGSILYLNPAVYQRQVVSSLEAIRNFPRTHYGVIWTSALKMSADHPAFGVGPRAFRDICPDPKYGPLAPYRKGDLRCATHPHNFYLEWLVETGVVGLTLFLLAMALVVRRLSGAVRRAPPDWVYLGLFVTLLARLWPLAPSTSFHHAWSAVPFWLVVGWGLSYSTLPLPRRFEQTGALSDAT